jgi:hypothetical protein
VTTTLTTTLADECGYHEGDNCQHCAEVLRHLRARGWTDAEILADIDLYRTDLAAWEAKVRARAAEVCPVSRALFDEDPAAYEPHGHSDRPAEVVPGYACPDHPGPLDDARDHVCRLRPLATGGIVTGPGPKLTGGCVIERRCRYPECECDRDHPCGRPAAGTEALAELNQRAGEHAEVCR